VRCRRCCCDITVSSFRLISTNSTTVIYLYDQRNIEEAGTRQSCSIGGGYGSWTEMPHSKSPVGFRTGVHIGKHDQVNHFSDSSKNTFNHQYSAGGHEHSGDLRWLVSGNGGADTISAGSTLSGGAAHISSSPFAFATLADHASLFGAAEHRHVSITGAQEQARTTLLRLSGTTFITLSDHTQITFHNIVLTVHPPPRSSHG
jgi:hypothetical protein